MTTPVNPGDLNPENSNTPGPAAGATPEAPSVGGAVGGAVGGTGGPSPLVWIIGALAAVAVLIGGIIFFTSGDGSNDDATPPPASVSVPSVIGFSLEEGTKSVESLGLIVGNITQIPSDEKTGTILDQNPMSGTQIVQGSRVDLVVAGQALPIVPDVENMKEQEAINALIAAGLKPGNVKKTNSPQPAGNVLAQHPRPGTQVEPGSEVNLTISNGKSGVPDVVGMTQAEAEANLVNAGFKYVVQEVEAQDRIGQVIQMNPKAGTNAKKGTTVTITVVKAAPPIPTPTPTPTPTNTEVGGKAKCDLATFTEFVEKKQDAAGVPLQKVSDFTCEDGWAVVVAQVGEPDRTQIKRFILEAEGQFWVQRKQTQACAPGSPLPNSLRPAACDPLVG